MDTMKQEQRLVALLQSADADERRQAVERLDPTTHGAVLVKVAVDDEDQRVRKAAKQRLAEGKPA